MATHSIDWKPGDVVWLGNWENINNPGMGAVQWQRKALLVARGNVPYIETVKVRSPIFNGSQWVFETQRRVDLEWIRYCGACPNPEQAKQVAEAFISGIAL